MMREYCFGIELITIIHGDHYSKQERHEKKPIPGYLLDIMLNSLTRHNTLE